MEIDLLKIREENSRNRTLLLEFVDLSFVGNVFGKTFLSIEV